MSQTPRRGKKSRERHNVGRQPDTRVSLSRNIPPVLGLVDSISAIPQEFKSTLTWAAFYAPSATGPASFADPLIVRLNSPYDPNDAFGGASATGYAKLMAMYTKCFVRGVRFTVRFMNESAFTGGAPIANVIVGCTINTNNTALTGFAAAVGNGLAEYETVGASPDVAKFTRTLDIGKFLDVPDILSNTSLYSTASANPTNIVYAHFWIENPVASTSAYVVVVADVEFECTFTDPVPFT